MFNVQIVDNIQGVQSVYNVYSVQKVQNTQSVQNAQVSKVSHCPKQTMIFWESSKLLSGPIGLWEAAGGPIGLKMNKWYDNIFQIWRWGPDFTVYNTSWDIEIVLINESDPEYSN